MSEMKKCPKCGGEIVEGEKLSSYGTVRFSKFGDLWGDKVIPLYCENCGYIELYKEMKERKGLNDRVS